MSKPVSIFQVRDWRVSKYPLRMTMRIVFLTYMWFGMWQYFMTPKYQTMQKNPYGANGLEYLTLIGFLGSTLTLFLSMIQEFIPGWKGIKVGFNGLFLVVEFMITLLYWGLYFLEPTLIHSTETLAAFDGPPPLYMDTAAHFAPVVAMTAEFLYSRTSKYHLYENRAVHIVLIIIFTLGYFAWILYLFNDNGQFPYPFLRVIHPTVRVAFTIFTAFLGLFIQGVVYHAYLKYHATEDDLPVLEEQFYDNEEEEE